MRLSLVTETYAPQVNGVSRTLGHLTDSLRAAGDAVQVIQPDYGSPVVDGCAHVYARAVRLPFYREVSLPIPPFGPVRRAIDAFKPDLVHIATEATLGLGLLRYVLRRGIPVVSSFHTNFDQYTSHYRLGWAQGLIWRYLRWFHNRTRETYVPSSVTLRQLEGRGFERLALWPRGVDSTLFDPARPGRFLVREALGFGPEDVVIGHVSRIAAEKNVLYLAEALDQVLKQRPRARVLIVGDGPERTALEQKLGAQARCVGYKTGADLADHYAAADLFAFASRTETFGNVILEAMASGLPVVALAAGGVVDSIDEGENGLAVDPEATPSTFAESLIRLVDDAEMRRRMAGAARTYAEGRTWDAIMSLLRSHYLAVLESASEMPVGAGSIHSRFNG